MNPRIEIASTEPGAFYPSKDRKSLFRFNPDVSTGTLIQIGVIVIGMMLAYGTYTADRKADQMRVTQLEIDAHNSRDQTKSDLSEVKQAIHGLSDKVNDLSTNIAVLNYQQQKK